MPAPVRARRRPLDRLGGDVWGGLDVWPSRYGHTNCRLTVLPPGTSLGERLRLRAWRACPALSAGTALVLLVVCGALALPPAEDGAVVAIGALVPAASLLRATRRRRRLVEVRYGATDAVLGRVVLSGDMARIGRWSEELRHADLLLAEGGITPAEHELLWGDVWLAMRDRRTLRTGHAGGSGEPDAGGSPTTTAGGEGTWCGDR